MTWRCERRIALQFEERTANPFQSAASSLASPTVCAREATSIGSFVTASSPSDVLNFAIEQRLDLVSCEPRGRIFKRFMLIATNSRWCVFVPRQIHETSCCTSMRWALSCKPSSCPFSFQWSLMKSGQGSAQFYNWNFRHSADEKSGCVTSRFANLNCIEIAYARARGRPPPCG